MKTFEQAVDKMTINLDAQLSGFRERVKKQEVATVSYRKGYSGGGSYSWGGIILLWLLVKFTRRQS